MKNGKKCIALFGGRFDPPHYGHLLVAEQIKELRPFIDEVWLVPAHTHPWKKMQAEPKHRLNMCRLIENEYIKTDSIDINRGGETYTIDTVKILKDKYPYLFHWVCGSDTLSDLSRWKEYNKLLLEIPFIIFPREGYRIKKQKIGLFDFVKNHSLLTSNYSSTVIRERIYKKLSVEGLVPPRVDKYIYRNNLYVQNNQYA